MRSGLVDLFADVLVDDRETTQDLAHSCLCSEFALFECVSTLRVLTPYPHHTLYTIDPISIQA